MILDRSLFRLTRPARELAGALADMGHHDESATGEYAAVHVFMRSLASRYADDSYNRQRFMVAAGYQTAPVTGGDPAAASGEGPR